MNIYARAGNEGYIEKEAKEIRKRDEYYQVKQEKTDALNLQRSIKQRINGLAKKHPDLSEDRKSEMEILAEEYERVIQEAEQAKQKEKKKKEEIKFPNTKKVNTVCEYDLWEKNEEISDTRDREEYKTPEIYLDDNDF